MSGFIIQDFVSVARIWPNSLLGIVTVRAPSGMVFHDCGVHKQNDSVWVSPASKAIINKDGTVQKDFHGRTRWTPVISFESEYARDKWSRAVVEALKAQKPEALA